MKLLLLHDTQKLITWLRDDRGMEVTVKATSEGPVRLSDYDHLLWFGNKLQPASKPVELIKFVEEGGNLVWAQAAGARLDSALIEMASQFGMKLSSQPALVQDADEEYGTEIRAQLVVRGESDYEHVVSKPGLLFKGHALTLDTQNPLVFPILTAPDTAFTPCTDSEECEPLWGKEQVLVGGLQARNGARVTIVGSMSQWGDKRWSDAWSELLNWSLGGSRLLELSLMQLQSPNHRIREPFKVQVCIMERLRLPNGATMKQPFMPRDLQVELGLMDPIFRLTLQPNPISGCLESQDNLILPSRYGVYRLSLRYQRHGWSHLIAKQEITIRPARYEDDPRWVGLAMPYHVTWILLLLICFFLLLPFWLIHEKLKSKQKAQ